MSQTKAQLIDPVDGTIVNADINASAAIQGSKISPDFGSQNVVTTGTLGSGALSVNSGTTNTCATFTSTDSGAVINLTDNSARSSIEQNGTDLKIISDTDAGDASSTIKFLVDNSTKMTLDSSGNLGIGIATAAQRLHVDGGSNDPFLMLQRSGAGDSAVDVGGVQMKNSTNILADIRARSVDINDGILKFSTMGAGSLSERLRIDNSGLVGIGTTSPSSYNNLADDLVIATSGDTGITIATGTSSQGSLFFADGTSGSALVEGFVAYEHGSNFLKFGTSNAERARIDSSGRLLVGTTDTPSKLTVDTDFCVVRSSNDPTINLLLGSSGSITQLYRILIDDSDSDKLQVRSGDSARITMTSAGLVGIGQTNPQRTLQINATDPGIRLEENSGSSKRLEMFVRTSDSTGIIAADQSAQQLAIRTNGADRFNINSKGGINTLFNDGDSVGVVHKRIGSSNTHNFFEIRSNGSTPRSGGTLQFTIKTNGNVGNTNNSYGSLSDVKLKENIVDAKSQWDDIKALKVRNYNFKSGLDYGTHTQIGLIAQEVEETSAGLVIDNIDRDDEGKDLGTVTKTLQYSVLHIKALKALQEAMAKIEVLESEVATLKSA